MKFEFKKAAFDKGLEYKEKVKKGSIEVIFNRRKSRIYGRNSFSDMMKMEIDILRYVEDEDEGVDVFGSYSSFDEAIVALRNSVEGNKYNGRDNYYVLIDKKLMVIYFYPEIKCSDGIVVDIVNISLEKVKINVPYIPNGLIELLEENKNRIEKFLSIVWLSLENKRRQYEFL
ncbi:MAG: hypothetical protein GY679_02190 [Mycoplasma sp.]|nr:hypothetical protein [Mycoplasma sp.]